MTVATLAAASGEAVASVNLWPSSRDIVNTSFEQSSGIGEGTQTCAAKPALCKNASKLTRDSASFVRSSSRLVASRNCAATLRKLIRLVSGATASSNLAAPFRNARSAISESATPGLITLTTTLWPVPRKVAACTCATDAVASGSRSKLAKVVESRLPKLCSTVFLTTKKGIGGASSRHFSNSLVQASGNNVGDDATSWPSFTKVAPSSSKSSLVNRGASVDPRKTLAPTLLRARVAFKLRRNAAVGSTSAASFFMSLAKSLCVASAGTSSVAVALPGMGIFRSGGAVASSVVARSGAGFRRVGPRNADAIGSSTHARRMVLYRPCTSAAIQGDCGRVMSDRCCFASRFVDSYWQRAAVVP